MLDRDYFTVPDEDIKYVRSLLTIVGCNVVHDPGIVSDRANGGRRLRVTEPAAADVRPEQSGARSTAGASSQTGRALQRAYLGRDRVLDVRRLSVLCGEARALREVDLLRTARARSGSTART